MEMVSLSVQIFLKMARVDVAEKSVMLMSRMEDDATLTQLTAGDQLTQLMHLTLWSIGSSPMLSARMHAQLPAPRSIVDPRAVGVPGQGRNLPNLKP